MKTIVFLVCGTVCFLIITALLARGVLPVGAYVILCLGGMSLVGYILRFRVTHLGSYITPLGEQR